MLAIEPSDQLIQELFGSRTVAIVQRQAEPIAKALRHDEMSASLFVGVGKEDFDPPLCIRRVVPSESGGDHHDVLHALLNFLHGSPLGLQVLIPHLCAPEREVLLITRQANPCRLSRGGWLLARPRPEKPRSGVIPAGMPFAVEWVGPTGPTTTRTIST